MCPYRKIKLRGDTVRRLDPDVAAFRKVGGEQGLGELQQALEEPYPHKRLSAYADGRGIHVGLISKHAIAKQENLAAFPPGPELDSHDIDAEVAPRSVDPDAANTLWIRVNKGGSTGDVITAHLQSKLASFRPSNSRTAFTPGMRTSAPRWPISGRCAARQRQSRCLSLA